jgi:AcrR family transcriptional regulator
VTKSAETVVNLTHKGQEIAKNPTSSRLIDALLDIWAESPAEGVSVRSVVRKAGAANASIHYHFGDLERLYVAASHAALEAARRWMAERLAELEALGEQPLTPQIQASLIASVLDGWTGPQRRLAMAWRYAPDAGWQAAWDGFWAQVAARLGLGEHADALACFAAGEAARHLLVWNPPLERALLEETALSLTRWLRERRYARDEVRPLYRTLADRGYEAPEPAPDAATATIAEAAAALLAESGHAGVTFRAVAARAGVTLGKVVHVQGSKSALLHAALHALYEREALGGDLEWFVSQQLPPEVVLAELLAAVLRGDQPVLAAYDEIERAIYNGGEYAGLRAMVRAMDDPSGTWALRQMLGGIETPASLVAVFSAIIRGIGYRARHSGSAERDLEAGARAALRPFVAG